MGVFLIAARGIGFVAGKAATLEVAARWWCAGWGFCDLGVLDCVRLWLFRLGARSRCEDDGAAEARWCCADDLGTWGECGEVAGEERL